MNSVKNKKKIRCTSVVLKNPNAPYKLSTYVQLKSLGSEVRPPSRLRGQAGNSTKGVGLGATGLTVVELGRGPSLPRALADAHLPSLGFESDLPQWEAAGGLF